MNMAATVLWRRHVTDMEITGLSGFRSFISAGSLGAYALPAQMSLISSARNSSRKKLWHPL